MSRFIDRVKKTAKKIADQDGVRESIALVLATIASLVVALVKKK